MISNQSPYQPQIQFLHCLFNPQSVAQSKNNIDSQKEADLANWIASHGIAPIAYYQIQLSWPALAKHLHSHYLQSLGQNILFINQIKRLNQIYTDANHTAVLLKGAALNQAIYPMQGLRNMGDIDIWIIPKYLNENHLTLSKSGQYQFQAEPQHHYSITSLANEEYKYNPLTIGDRMLELHGKSFPGWWLEYAAEIDECEIWRRAVSNKQTKPFLILSPEDQIIHLAVHTSIGHQLSSYVLHAYIDIAFVIQTYKIDWDQLISRAKTQKLKTVVWFILSHLNFFFDLDLPLETINLLAPTKSRQIILNKLVRHDQILDQHDFSSRPHRLLILLAMTDNLKDMVTLIGRTLWPSKNTLTNINQSKFFRLRRLINLLRTQQI